MNAPELVWKETAATVEGQPVLRAAYVAPGYDCFTRPCRHKPRGSHGRHGDEWRLCIRCDDYALELVLHTNVLERAEMISLTDSEWRLVSPARCTRHSAFPVEEETVRRGDEPDDCYLLDACYPDGDTLCRFAEEVWTDLDTEAMRPYAFESHESIARRLVEDRPAWHLLTRSLEDFRRQARAAAAELPVRCAACLGRGVVPASGAR